MAIDPSLVDEATRMRMRNFKEIDNDQANKLSQQKDGRMCGCEACVIF
jgi:hypothetical protein